MRKDHRREVYSPVSEETRQAPDATGPEGVRVTIRIEPAVDRLLRMRLMFFTPTVLSDPVRAYVDYRILPKIVQETFLKGRWAVVVEADSGEHCRVKARDQAHALDYARQIHDGVEERGVAFLSTFAS